MGLGGGGFVGEIVMLSTGGLVRKRGRRVSIPIVSASSSCQEGWWWRREESKVLRE